MDAAKTWIPRLFAPALAVIALGVSVSFLMRDEAEFDYVYRQAASQLAAGEDFYPEKDGYVYPPFAAWLMLPLADLPTLPARAIWLTINLGACWLLIYAAWQASGGGALANLHEHAIFWSGLGTALFYLLNAFNHTQTDILIGALVMGGCLALVRGRSLVAACGFGLAAAFKCTPLLWCVYFVWRGKLLAAATVVAVFVGVNLLPNLAADAPGGRWWLVHWHDRYLSGVSKSTAEVGAWHTAPRYNQSLNGAVQRLFFVDPGWSDVDRTFHETPRAATFDRQTVKWIVLACEAALVLGCLWGMGGFWTRSHGSAIDASVICILMLLLSPMSGKAHFGILILPGFVLARLAISETSRSATVALALSVPLILSGRLLTGQVGLYALWWGNVTWHTIVLLGGCLFALRRPNANVPIAVQILSLERKAA